MDLSTNQSGGEVKEKKKQSAYISLTGEEFLLVRDMAAELGMSQNEFLRSLMEPSLRVLMHTRGGR